MAFLNSESVKETFIEVTSRLTVEETFNRTGFTWEGIRISTCEHRMKNVATAPGPCHGHVCKTLVWIRVGKELGFGLLEMEL